MVSANKKKFIKLDDVIAYKISSELSDYVWMIVSGWDWFSKKTLGYQWVESTDSVASNIAEGWGRFHKRDKQKFYYNARGSVYESAHWLKRAGVRGLIENKEKDFVLNKLRILPKEINLLIKITQNKLKI
ncbi:MAG: four helix bundle protein [Candidatus Shapirobacteria bacterium]|nr:four helix bundle protein [Candidatus Shapirobacteria bacterium]